MIDIFNFKREISIKIMAEPNSKVFWFFILLIFSFSFNLLHSQTATLSGLIQEQTSKAPLSYVGLVLKTEKDSAFVLGTLTNDEGRFTFAGVKPGNYLLFGNYLGFDPLILPIRVGQLSPFLDLGTQEMREETKMLEDVVITGKQDAISGKLDKKVFQTEDLMSQSGGSVLDVMQSLPGISVAEGKVQLRGNDKVAVLVDGKQTSLTGFGNQTGLGNIPASAIERIEIIQNPSAKFDANGNAGIINIIFKKNSQEGFNGRVGLTAGVGALWEKRENYPSVRPQYSQTPKANPSLSLNYRKNKVNIFFQGDVLYTQTLNKNEYTDRYYDSGEVVLQQLKRNRTTTIGTGKLGFDWNLSEHDQFTVSGLFSSEKILDRGDEPFYTENFAQQIRMWQFLEDELKTTLTASSAFSHTFKQAGHSLLIGFNFTFHREDEKYFFTNTLPDYTGFDSFKLLSDEYVGDLNVDYVKPLKYGRVEAGIKIRRRENPTDMQFFPGIYSPIDSNAGGWATYLETIPAAYTNYVIEGERWELEAGLRLEYVGLNYLVNPNHNTYKSDGYDYIQPFPNVRTAFKINDRSKITAFYNRRVDRPNEVDIRIFPKYDDAEVIKIGNPELRPQFTQALELGYKRSWGKGFLYGALYGKISDGTISRIATTFGSSNLVYSIMQNADKSYAYGFDAMLSEDVAKWFSFNIGANVYQNIIESFSVLNRYPVPNIFTAPRQSLISGNAKWNGIFHFPGKWGLQVTAIYLAPDLIPQGKTNARFALDLGIKKTTQKGKGEWVLNASDLLNTMIIGKEIQGTNFRFESRDYYETQVIRLGYFYKF